MNSLFLITVSLHSYFPQVLYVFTLLLLLSFSFSFQFMIFFRVIHSSVQDFEVLLPPAGLFRQGNGTARSVASHLLAIMHQLSCHWQAKLCNQLALGMEMLLYSASVGYKPSVLAFWVNRLNVLKTKPPCMPYLQMKTLESNSAKCRDCKQQNVYLFILDS